MPLATAMLQAGLPDTFVDLLGIAGAIVLVLIMAALAGTAYKRMTGGIEWPEDTETDEDTVRRSHDDDEEWEFY